MDNPMLQKILNQSSLSAQEKAQIIACIPYALLFIILKFLFYFTFMLSTLF